MKIIYFVDGFAPSEDEKLEAESFGIKTVFRNAHYIYDDAEKCDGVAGAVIPDAYKDYPTADELVDARQSAREAARKRLAERVAGVSETPPNEPPKGNAASGGGEPPTEWGKNQ